MEKRINPKKFYTPSEIADLGLFPWIKSEKSVRNWLIYQYEHGNRWKIIRKSPDGSVDAATAKHGIRWFVPGKAIIKIKASFDDGSLWEDR